VDVPLSLKQRGSVLRRPLRLLSEVGMGGVKVRLKTMTEEFTGALAHDGRSAQFGFAPMTASGCFREPGVITIGATNDATLGA
jgi:hypothetical protein